MNDSWEQFSPYWLQTAAPFGVDLGPQASPAPPGGGLLSNLNRSWNRSGPSGSRSETPTGGNGGILGLLAPPADSRPADVPHWLQTAMPFGADFGPPALQIKQPWDYPRAHQLLMAMLDPSTLPIPPALPPMFPPAPPLEHLDSAKYWGAASAPSGASGSPPAHGFYLSPVPQAPSWDEISTHAADNTAQIFPQPPSPPSWGAAAPGMGAARSSPSDEFNVANGGISGLAPPPAKPPWDTPLPRQLPPAMWDPSTLPIPPALPPMFASVPPNGSWNESTPSLWQIPAGANVGFPAPPAATEIDPASGQYIDAPQSNPGATTAVAPTVEHPVPSPMWPVVPAGNPDDGPWTSVGGGGAQYDPRVMSDVTPDNDWKPGAQYAQSPGGRGSGPPRINERLVEVEPGQAARLTVAEARAHDATTRVRELDPNWRPTPSIQEGVEGAIRANEAEAERAEARIRELTRFKTSPIIPRERPATEKERNNVAREIARWFVKNQGHVVEGADWLFEYEPSVQAYLDPPKSLEELQQAAAMPKKGYDVHHIAERKSAEDDGFPNPMIHGPENLVRIPRFKHWEINGWYGRPNEDFGESSPREYLRGKDWDERIRVGLDALVKHKVLKP